jgi:hypothetical protein
MLMCFLRCTQQRPSREQDETEKYLLHGKTPH